MNGNDRGPVHWAFLREPASLRPRENHASSTLAGRVSRGIQFEISRKYLWAPVTGLVKGFVAPGRLVKVSVMLGADCTV